MATRTSVVKVLVDTDASGAGSKLSKFGKFAGAAALGVGALAVGGALAAKKIYDIGDASDDANAKVENVAKQMKLFGKSTEEVTARIEKYAEKTALATGVDANSIKATQAKLLTFRDLGKSADKAGGAFDRATNAAVDMAALGFGTAETNAVLLGKALQDPVNGLTSLKKTGALTQEQIEKIGGEFERTGDKAKAQNDILKAVESQVKGTAEATAGGWERMQEAFRQGGDALAKKFLPYMDRFGNWLIDVAAPKIKEVSGDLREKFGPAFKRVGDFIRERVIPASQEFYRWFVEKIAPGIKKTVTPVIDGAKQAFKDISEKIKDNRKPLGELFNALKKVAEFMADKIMPIFGKQFGEALKIAGKAIGTYIDFVSKMIDVWQKVATAIQRAIDKAREFAGMDKGHAEVYTPSGGSTPGSGGGSGGNPNATRTDRGGVTVNVHGNVLSTERDIARAVEQAVRRARINGRGMAVA